MVALNYCLHGRAEAGPARSSCAIDVEGHKAWNCAEHRLERPAVQGLGQGWGEAGNSLIAAKAGAAGGRCNYLSFRPTRESVHGNDRKLQKSK